MDKMRCHWLAQGLGAGLALAVAGCATVPRGGALQVLELEVVTPQGAALASARCELDSAQGSWTAVAPGPVSVGTGAGPLRVRCRAGVGGAMGEVAVEARVEGARWKRTLAGAGIGIVGGALLGAATSRHDPQAICCSGPGFGAMAGSVVGLLIAMPIAALTADPAYAYPAKVRVVLQPPPAEPR
jgi:hypothetical protein